MNNYFLLQENAIPAILIIIFSFITGIYILITDYKKKSNIQFFLFVLFLGLWLITSAISLNAVNDKFAGFIYQFILLPFVVFCLEALLSFSYNFPKKVKSKLVSVLYYFSLIFAGSFLLLLFSQNLLFPVASRKLISGGTYGIFYPNCLVKFIFLSWLVTVILIFVTTFIVKIIKFTGADRRASFIVMFGILTSLGNALIFAGLLPAIGLPQFSFISYFTGVLFVIFIRYAILNYHLLKFTFSSKLIFLLLIFFLLSYGITTYNGCKAIKRNFLTRLNKLTMNLSQNFERDELIDQLNKLKLIEPEIEKFEIIDRTEILANSENVKDVIVGDRYYLIMESPVKLYDQKLRIYFSPYRYRASLNQFILLSLLYLSILLIVMFIVAPFFWKAGMILPLNRILEASKAVAKGDLDFQIEITSQDEMGVLAENFNHMITDLKKYTIDLKEKERLKSKIGAARDIQTSLLPDTRFIRSTVDVVAVNIAADEVSGDFYDITRVDDTHFSIHISDVSGKSLTAALFMLLSRSIIRVTGDHILSPSEIMNRANKFIFEDSNNGMFVTTFYLVYDTVSSKFKYSSAGHWAQLLIKNNSEIQLLQTKGPPLGVNPAAKFNEKEFQLEKNDTLILFTDGVFELENEKGEEFGMENFTDLIMKNINLSTEKLLSETISFLVSYSHTTKLFDDITMLITRK